MPKRTLRKSLLSYLALAALAVISTIFIVLLIFRFISPPTSAFMLGYLADNPKKPLKYQWVDLEEITPLMPLAVIASEDQKFFNHWGLDLHAITTAIEDYQQGESLRGASTISQQTAKNLFLWNGRQFIRKALEAGLTVGLELAWDKKRIIEVYLNIAEFGEGIYGVEAASRHYIGVSAKNLNLTQAALLASSLPNPKRFVPSRPSNYMWKRVNWITKQMQQLGGTAYVKQQLNK
jgi:monofunctional biosynthetic peptidoglycan transglycosylase